MTPKNSPYIAADKLVKLKPNAECCDCGADPSEYGGQYLWVFHDNRLVYCPECADNEGWLLEEQ